MYIHKILYKRELLLILITQLCIRLERFLACLKLTNHPFVRKLRFIL